MFFFLKIETSGGGQKKSAIEAKQQKPVIHKQMQPTPAGGRSGSGGVGSEGEPSDGGGLARFRSAPATWLEALLDEEEEDLLKPNQCFTQLLSNNLDLPSSQKLVSFSSSTDQDLFQLGSSDGFLRQNSSPAVFLANGGIGSDGFFLNTGISASNGFQPPNMEISPTTSKRAREAKIRNIPPKFSVQKEEQIEEVLGGVSSSIDMEIDKLLEDSVPCRVRAKRGCATHPRSIAERVRRTRISDRIRKLQELVPNMDRQTNTADMLEEAVEYVKYLQKQIQELSEHQRRCTCMGKAE